MSVARDAFASGVVGGKLYAIGGSNGINLDVVEEYRSGRKLLVDEVADADSSPFHCLRHSG